MRPALSMKRFNMLQKNHGTRKWGTSGLSYINHRPYYFGQVDGFHKGNSDPLPSAMALRTEAKSESVFPSLLPAIISKIQQNQLPVLPVKMDRAQTKSHVSDKSIDASKDEYTLGQLLDLNVIEIPFQLEKLVPKESLVILAGPSEIGKSTFYTQLAIAIAEGQKEFLGLKLNLTYKKVLIISTEDGPVPFAYRVNKQLSGKSPDSKANSNMVVIFNFQNLEKRIEEILAKTQVDLVIIDAFGDVFWGDINATNSVRTYLNKFRDIIQKYHCSVMFVHHICKGKRKQQAEKDLLLGSTGIEGKMRNVLMLTIVNNQHQLSIVKGNYVGRADKNNPIYLDFNEATLTFSISDEPAKPVETGESTIASGSKSRQKVKPGRKGNPELKTLAFKLYNEGVPQIEIAKKVGRDKSTVCKWIKEFKEKKKYDLSKFADEVD
jgi:archaellum biogenesis ATPase FlaH